MTFAPDVHAIEGRFASALLDPARPIPWDVADPMGHADPLRFAVYRNNVAATLIGALEARLPTVRRLVGDAFFRDMARAFITVERPRSPLLHDYGTGFADFVERFAPAASVPYLADVARVDDAWLRAYVAADADPIGLDRLAALDPEVLAAASLRPHPSARLVVSAFPVGTIWMAHRTDPIGPVRDWTAEGVLVVRPAASVDVHVLPPGDVAFAAAVLAGRPLADAALAACDPAFDFGRALVGLVSAGAFVAVVPASGDRP
jgi:hypothetical protein